MMKQQYRPYPNLLEMRRLPRNITIKKMTNGKSPGIDQITAEVLKAGGEDMAEMLLHIAKNVTLTSKTPLACTKMVVTPIHKKGNRLDSEII